MLGKQPIKREGALYQKSLGDGRELCVYNRIYNAILTIGSESDDLGYTTHYCYENPIQAIMAGENWDGSGEPEGWFRHADSGRRRPNGDPALEYIAP